MRPEDEARAVAGVAQRLTARFPQVPGDTVASVVDDVYSRFAASRVRAFIPILVERAAVNRLIADRRWPDG